MFVIIQPRRRFQYDCLIQTPSTSLIFLKRLAFIYRFFLENRHPFYLYKHK